MRRSTSLVLAAVVGLAVAGCGSSASDGGSATSPTTDVTVPTATAAALDGRTFVSQSVSGFELAEGADVTLAFADDRLVASGGCNTLSGPYEVSGTSLRWTAAGASTQMACEDPARMEQDAWLSRLLTEGMRAELDGDALTLTAEEVSIELLDETAVTPDRPLEGTAWTLESITLGDTVMSVPEDVTPPTLTIEDGRAAVFAGCNRGSATVTVADDGTTATFGPLALTRMACGPSADQVESAVVAMLDGEVEVEVQGDVLTLTKDGRGLTYRAG